MKALPWVAVLVSTLLLSAACTSAVPGEAVGVAERSTAGSSSTSSSVATTSGAAPTTEVTAEDADEDEDVVLVARLGIDRSTDGGRTWQRSDQPAVATLAAGSDVVVAGGPDPADALRGAVYSSDDSGETWSEKMPFDLPVQAVAYGDGTFLALSADGDRLDGGIDFTASVSTDGRTWTAAPVSVPSDLGGYPTLSGLAWDGQTWTAALVTGEDEGGTTTVLLSSADGVAWTIATRWDGLAAIGSLAWSGEQWGYVGHVLDGYTYDTDFRPHTRPLAGSATAMQTWTAAVPTPADLYLDGLSCTADGWLALSVRWWDQDQTTPQQLQRSTDLAAWEPWGAPLPAVESETPLYAYATEALVLGADPAAPTCGSAVTTPMAEFPLQPPAEATAPTAPGAPADPGTGPELSGMEGDGWCEVTDSTGKAVLLASSITIMPGYPPSTMDCDQMVLVWEGHLSGSGEYLDCTLGPDQNAAGGALAGFLATCPVSAKFALFVADRGSAAAQAMVAVFAQDRDAAPEDAGTSAADGDLGLSTPMTRPPCDGSLAVIVGSAINPAAYAADVQALLDAHPGAAYVRTDQSCSSFVQQIDGNPLYAVFFLHPPGTGCEAVYAQGGDANGRLMQDSTPEAARLNC